MASEPRPGLTKAVRDTLGRAKLSTAYKNLKASGMIPESAQVKPAPASDVALIAAAYTYLEKTEDNESREMSLELTQEIRDMLGRGMLYTSNQKLKDSGEIPADESAEVQPVHPSDVALIAAAYQFLQESGQIPPPPSCSDDVICCVRSSDELTDFFVANGLGACQDLVCKFIGIESVEDLKLISADDLHGTRFSTWASGSLTMVQYKKLIQAFTALASA